MALVYNETIAESVRQWVLVHHGSTAMTENQKRQAMVPQGTVLFDNGAGTAPGVAMQQGGKTLVHLPGPPTEMRWMYENRLKPWLLQTFGSQGCIASRYIKIYDMGEAFIEEKLMDLVKEQSNPTLAMYARPGFVEVRLTARADWKDQAESLLEPLEEEVRSRLAGQIVSFDDDTMAHVLGQLVRDQAGYIVPALPNRVPERPDRFAHHRHTRYVRLLPRLGRDVLQ